MSDDAQASADAPVSTDSASQTSDQPVTTQVESAPAVAQPDSTTQAVAPSQPQQLNQPPKAPDTPKVDWESDENPFKKRFSDVQPHASRLYNEVKPWRELGVTPQQVQQMVAEQKQREAASNLKPWNSGHSDYKRFAQVKQTATEYQKALHAAGDDETKRGFVNQLYADRFAPEDLKMIAEANQDRQEMLESFQSDPRGFIAQHVSDVVKQHIEQYESYQNTRTQAQGWLQDPGNAPLIEKHRDDMLRMMDPNVPARDKAIEHARLLAEVEQLKSQLGSSAQKNLQSDARHDLLTRRSAGTSRRNAPQSRESIGDPVKHLMDKGLQPGTPAFATALSRLNNPQ
jgi:hypothetical protein